MHGDAPGPRVFFPVHCKERVENNFLISRPSACAARKVLVPMLRVGTVFVPLRGLP